MGLRALQVQARRPEVTPRDTRSLHTPAGGWGNGPAATVHATAQSDSGDLHDHSWGRIRCILPLFIARVSRERV
jgi:hypothetical protein